MFFIRRSVHCLLDCSGILKMMVCMCLHRECEIGLTRFALAVLCAVYSVRKWLETSLYKDKVGLSEYRNQSILTVLQLQRIVFTCFDPDLKTYYQSSFKTYFPGFDAPDLRL